MSLVDNVQGKNAIAPILVWTGDKTVVPNSDLAAAGFTAKTGIYIVEIEAHGGDTGNLRCQSTVFVKALSGVYYFGDVTFQRWSTNSGFAYYQHSTPGFRGKWWNTGSGSSGDLPIRRIYYYEGTEV